MVVWAGRGGLGRKMRKRSESLGNEGPCGFYRYHELTDAQTAPHQMFEMPIKTLSKGHHIGRRSELAFVISMRIGLFCRDLEKD